MNQNENPVFGGHADVDIAILRFGIVDIWIGKQKRVIEDRLAFIKGYCHGSIVVTPLSVTFLILTLS